MKRQSIIRLGCFQKIENYWHLWFFFSSKVLKFDYSLRLIQFLHRLLNWLELWYYNLSCLFVHRINIKVGIDFLKIYFSCRYERIFGCLFPSLLLSINDDYTCNDGRQPSFILKIMAFKSHFAVRGFWLWNGQNFLMKRSVGKTPVHDFF